MDNAKNVIILAMTAKVRLQTALVVQDTIGIVKLVNVRMGITKLRVMIANHAKRNVEHATDRILV